MAWSCVKHLAGGSSGDECPMCRDEKLPASTTEGKCCGNCIYGIPQERLKINGVDAVSCAWTGPISQAMSDALEEGGVSVAMMATEGENCMTFERKV